MNTEPPEGDDLHRMLVSMKQNVLERATPRPKRRTPHTGIVITVVGLLALGTATGAVALTLAHRDQPVAAPAVTQEPKTPPSATTPISAPITATPTPRPTPTPSPSPTGTPTAAPRADVRIPGECYFLVPQPDYLRFFGAAALSEQILSPGLSRHPDGNDRIQGLRGEHESLLCTWQNEGVQANLVLQVGRTADLAPGMAQETDGRLGGTSQDPPGGTCQDRLGGRVCQSTGSGAQGPAVTATTFERDGVTIKIYQTDFPTDGLLAAVVGEIWGD
ncbi:hypothetical protein [Curtobacterium sp. ISL-83]|uniref:hypothetical protein n=1 Tax=Curtobacterium sp. ISL-83 TaxID=2819145 RepID=UPI001BEA1E65|nr:hypothetical protein [Curtobacterium sp. ISL-83]MBT2502541.1 hypothetical protein [Curtobacterium sp. ISL-83]